MIGLGHRRLASLVGAMCMLIASAVPAMAAPLQVPAPPREGITFPENPPVVSAPSWILFDADASVVLASQAPDDERSMASTTKIMTALVALKYGDLDDRVVVSERAAAVGESEIGLVPGEEFPLSMLLTAIVVRSANDAAMAVAEHVGGSVEGFADMMNDEAAELGLTHSHFANPHGLDEEGHYSSARDLLTIGLAVMDYPEFREMATTREAVFPDAPDGTRRVATATNRLLDTYAGMIGVKTGYTNKADLVLVGAAERENRTLFSVVMGSTGAGGHFVDTAILLDFGFDRFRTIEVATEGSRYEPDEPVRLVEVDPDPLPEEEEPPVVVQTRRESDGDPPTVLTALGWVERWFEELTGG